MPTVLFASEYHDPVEWLPALRHHMPEIKVTCWPEVPDPDDIDVLLAWTALEEAVRLPNLKLVQCLGAGIDHLVGLPIPDRVPLARLVDNSQVAGFVEYVVGAVLGFHRDRHHFRKSQEKSCWTRRPRMLSCERRVGIMGLGEMGAPCAIALSKYDFSVSGWSRTLKTLPGVQCYAGERQLNEFLQGLDILVCALPLTPGTDGILNDQLFSKLALGACVINVGRGGHCNEQHLVDALASGRLSGALLDVTSVEPLPTNHPLWNVQGLEITPHIATSQSANSAAAIVAENIRRVRAGHVPLGAVDRTRGY
ncbi:D-3-phosphoglycerate dehydrogenase [Paraburkholderia unamae]|uniref:2-hydroxyacid dehydrogenase n=1 Tax=Paraburkholderia unamae TaxID=219649 RepID=UPI001CB4FBD9|nr:glyoxylate/hydroxypyruvate reductase A [Paraburkholderia unamae]CAG9275223.1 D-3-phosphoglycerate dehydrogenase [Paraburkholderia unamae]